jgi:hypothetical protein
MRNGVDLAEQPGMLILGVPESERSDEALPCWNIVQNELGGGGGGGPAGRVGVSLFITNRPARRKTTIAYCLSTIDYPVSSYPLSTLDYPASTFDFRLSTALFIQLQYRQKRFLRHLYISDLSHTFLARFLFLQ